MKNLKKIMILLIPVALFACKKTEVTPCYLIEWEKTTTYEVDSELRYKYPNGQIERGSELQCNITKESIEALLKSMNTSQKQGGTCITVHAVYRKVSSKN